MSKPADRYQILEDEPAARLPLCLLIDKSFSMRAVAEGKPTGRFIEKDGRRYKEVIAEGPNLREQLVAAVRQFVKDILGDLRTRASVELAIMTFGADVRLVRDFLPVEEELLAFDYAADDDGTRLGQGLVTAMDLLQRRKKDYSEFSIECYQPQLVVLTDGQHEDTEVFDKVASQIVDLTKKRKLSCFPFLMGAAEGNASLKRLTPEGVAFRVEGTNLAALLKWFSASAARYSRSVGGGDDINRESMFDELRNGAISVDQF